MEAEGGFKGGLIKLVCGRGSRKCVHVTVRHLLRAPFHVIYIRIMRFSAAVRARARHILRARVCVVAVRSP